MKRRGFTLIELLVVVAIIALLIAILLPSLGRARDTAKTVRCSSNLKSLYTGIVLYASQNDDTFLPCCIQSVKSSFQGRLWAGYDTLGLQFGTLGTDTGANQTLVAAQIDKMLDCPCVDHNAAWGGIIDVNSPGGTEPWDRDYTYNKNVGYNEGTINSVTGAITSVFKSDDGFTTVFMKRVDLPRTTLVALDDRERDGAHDYSFGTLSNLFPPGDVIGGTILNASTGTPGDGASEVGIVHKMGTQTNMLFATGEIITDDANKKISPGGDIHTNAWIINPHIPPATGFPF